MKKLKNPEKVLRKNHFPTGNRNLIQRKKEILKKKEKTRARKLIRAENTADIITAMKEEDLDSIHCVTCGDFVMGDLLVKIIEQLGVPEKLTVSTLSLSKKNVLSLSKLLSEHDFHFTLLLSHYFKNTNGEIYTAIEKQLIEAFPDRFKIKIYRTHAKVFLFDYGNEKITIESSANLRSSNNIEQFSIFYAPEIYSFHAQWMDIILNHKDES